MLAAGLGIVIAIGAFAAYDSMRSPRQPDSNGTVCTLDAFVCPDGTVVGRIPPSCDFAPCPAPAPETRLETRIDQGASGLDVKVTPHEVLEDSRCPIGATCVWAGTVRVRATLESGLGTANQVFELNAPVTTEAEVIELVQVMPEARLDVAIRPADYRFIFRVAKRPPLAAPR